MNNPKNTRKCCACQGRDDKCNLIRVARNGNVAFVDESGKADGRGAYVHKNAECVAKLKKKKALSHALKMNVPEDVYARLEALASGDKSQSETQS